MEPLAPPEFFPYGIYSVPEISTAGLTEEGMNSGMMKMIFSTKTGRPGMRRAVTRVHARGILRNIPARPARETTGILAFYSGMLRQT
jgi:pyruvate/2-oxoglutarate dehydrogenase complex dihydrolipoamide dehydrogenase (E3) component